MGQSETSDIEGRDYLLVCDRCYLDAPGGRLICTCPDGDVMRVFPCAVCGFDLACGDHGEDCHS